MIDLIVSDGIEDSEPDFCVITVVEALKTDVRVLPQILNLKQPCRQIVAWMTLPKGIGIDDIEDDEPMLLLPGRIEPISQRVLPARRWTGRRVSIVAFYDIDAMGELSANTTLELSLTTRLTSGQFIYGNDSIRIIAPKPRRPRAVRRHRQFR